MSISFCILEYPITISKLRSDSLRFFVHLIRILLDWQIFYRVPWDFFGHFRGRKRGKRGRKRGRRKGRGKEGREGRSFIIA